MGILTITSVKKELIKKTYSFGATGFSNVVEPATFVTFSNGNKVKLSSLLSFLGNEGIDSWKNVEKIKRSNSDKNISSYLNNFVDQLVNGLKLA